MLQSENTSLMDIMRLVFKLKGAVRVMMPIRAEGPHTHTRGSFIIDIKILVTETPHFRFAERNCDSRRAAHFLGGSGAKKGPSMRLGFLLIEYLRHSLGRHLYKSTAIRRRFSVHGIPGFMEIDIRATMNNGHATAGSM
jgi:hypothetical protein